mgnify:CR=1 FL=1
MDRKHRRHGFRLVLPYIQQAFVSRETMRHLRSFAFQSFRIYRSYSFTITPKGLEAIFNFEIEPNIRFSPHFLI